MEYFDTKTIKYIRDSLPLSEYARNYIELQPKKDKLFGLCPFHFEDTPSFMIDPKSQRYYCFGCHCSGDIFTFIMNIENVGYGKAVEKAAKLVGTSIEVGNQSATLTILKDIDKRSEQEIITHEIISKEIYNSYDEWIEPSWVDEGVPSDMFAKYEIRIDRKNNRVIYPVYNTQGQFINIKGRTRVVDFKRRKIPKYINYYKVGGVDYLQGLHLARNSIVEKGEVVIFEGIKSCMKAEGLGFHNVVSAETSVLNAYQIDLLLSLQVKVVIAFDKDKTLDDYYNKNLAKLRQFVPLYYIDDADDLLGDVSEKNSPVDKGEDVWLELYNNRKEVKK